MSADLRSVVARLTTFRCTWTAQEVSALVDVPLSGVRRYLSTLVHLAVLTVTDGKHSAGPAARAWRKRDPKRKGPSTYGNSVKYRAQRQVWEQIATRDWEAGGRNHGRKERRREQRRDQRKDQREAMALTSQEQSPAIPSSQHIAGDDKMGSYATTGASLTYEQAADELSVSIATVQREVKRGRIQAFRVGLRGVRITRESLEKYRTASLSNADAKA